jgi:hypothetical protein
MQAPAIVNNGPYFGPEYFHEYMRSLVSNPLASESIMTRFASLREEGDAFGDLTLSDGGHHILRVQVRVHMLLCSIYTDLVMSVAMHAALFLDACMACMHVVCMVITTWLLHQHRSSQPCHMLLCCCHGSCMLGGPQSRGQAVSGAHSSINVHPRKQGRTLYRGEQGEAQGGI